MIRIFTSLFVLCLSFSVNAEKWNVAGPAAVVSYPLIVIAEQQSLKEHGIDLEFQLWRNPDQLRTMVVNKDVVASAMPSNVAATFYNKGQNVRLLNVSIWSILWLMSDKPELNDWNQLDKQSVVVPFRNDMPAIVFNTINQAQQTPATVTLEHTQGVLEAGQRLLSGQVNIGVMIEPAASAVVAKSKNSDRPLYRNMELSQVWGETFPDMPQLPQAGLASITLETEQQRKLLADAYKQSADWCKANVAECAELVSRHVPLPVPVIKSAIKHSELSPKPVSDVKPALEAFYQLLMSSDAKKVGGKMPSAEFYL